MSSRHERPDQSRMFEYQTSNAVNQSTDAVHANVCTAMSWFASRSQRQNAIDMYLSTDDEGEDGGPKRSAAQMAKEEALHRSQLARARKLAQRRMDRHEEREIERAFAVLDNVPEKESSPLFGSRKKSKPELGPALNPYIDHEALEVGDSDSNLADVDGDNDTFIASDSSPITVSNIEITREDDDGGCGRKRKQKPSQRGRSRRCQEEKVAFESEEESDGGSRQEGATMYEDFVASREAVEAQIAEDAAKRWRYQFCDSSDDEPNTSNRNGDECSGGEMEVEEETSFSSVETQTQAYAMKRRSHHFGDSSDEEQPSVGSSCGEMEAEVEASFSSVVGPGV